MDVINIGFGNMLAVSRVVVILAEPSAASSKRLKNVAEQDHKLVDTTCGRKTRSIIVTDSDHVVLSSIQAKTVAQKLKQN